jgi:hypothetical protein
MTVGQDYTTKALVTAAGAALLALGFILWTNWIWRTILFVFVVVFVLVTAMSPEHRWWRTGLALIVAAKVPGGAKAWFSAGSVPPVEAGFEGRALRLASAKGAR